MKNIPVYTESLVTAASRNEDRIFHKSHEANLECAEAIERKIGLASYKKGFDINTAIYTVVSEYGSERVAWVLAGIVNASGDRRWSEENRIWARSFETSREYSCYIPTHVNLLQEIVSVFRKNEYAPTGTEKLQAIADKLTAAMEQEGLTAAEMKKVLALMKPKAAAKPAPAKDKNAETFQEIVTSGGDLPAHKLNPAIIKNKDNIVEFWHTLSSEEKTKFTVFELNVMLYCLLPNIGYKKKSKSYLIETITTVVRDKRLSEAYKNKKLVV